MPLDPTIILQGANAPEVDPLQSMAKVQSLRNLGLQQQGLTLQNQSHQLEIQQQQNALRDQKAMTDAMHQWDGKDYSELPSLMVKNGASANAVIGMKQHIVDQQAKMATLNKDQLDNQAKKNDGVAAILANISSLPPEQQAAAFEQGKALAVHMGWISPEEAQQYSYQGPQALDLMRKTLLGHKGMVEAAKQNSEIEKNTAELPGIQAKSEQGVRSNAATKLATAMDKDQYANLWGELPAKVAQFFPHPNNWTPEAKDMILEAGMTPDQMGMMRQPTEASLALKSAKGDANAERALKRLDQSKRESRPVVMNNVVPGANGTQLAPQQEATVQAILEGRMTPPSSFALKTPYWQGIMGEVFKRDPQFSEQRAQLRKSFTQDKEIGAINTALGHIGVMGEAIDALNNGNLRALNSIANRIGVATGSNPVTTFNTIVHRVGPELSKAYIGAGGSAGERGADERDFDPSLGPQQLKSNVAISAKLLGSKIASKAYQWDQNKSDGMPTFEQKFLMPEAKQVLAQWGGKSGNAGGKTPPPGLTNIHVNPQTNESIGWDGKQWVKF